MRLVNIAFVFSFILLGRSSGTCLTCEKCQPGELLDAPGIGINLSNAYGTGVIRYWNDTYIPIAKIEGNEAYVSSMKILARTVMTTGNEEPPQLEDVPFLPQYPPAPPEVGIFGLRKDSAMGYILERLIYGEQMKYFPIPDKVLKPDLSALAPETQATIKGISGMIESLMRSIMDVQTLNNVNIFISLPDWVDSLQSQYYFEHDSYFYAAALQAGVAIKGRPTKASNALFNLHGIDLLESCPETSTANCPWEEEEMDGSHNCNKILSIVYDNGSLELTWGIIDRSFPSISLGKTIIHYDLGHNSYLASNNKSNYWEKLKSTIIDFLDPTPLKDVMILQAFGEKASNKEFLAFLRDIFAENICLKGAHYMLPLEDYLFGVAKYNAIKARAWMRRGDQCGACAHREGCPVSKEIIPGGEYGNQYWDDKEL